MFDIDIEVVSSAQLKMSDFPVTIIIPDPALFRNFEEFSGIKID